MPTYEYICESCGNQLEQFQSITAKPLRKCPACGKNKLKRLIGAGAGVIFKGTGFYATDYRSEGYKKKSESEKPAPAKDAGEKKTETKKTETKDTKPAKKDKSPQPEKK
jgi:putative FmdB family regulatory protein